MLKTCGKGANPIMNSKWVIHWINIIQT